MKPRSAYIDHSYHKITGSTRFFIDLLSVAFRVDVYWDESWNGGPPVNLAKIAEGNYDAIVFFQTMYPPYLLDVLNCDNIICIPMYDNVHAMEDSFWSRYRDKARFICFSSSLHERLSSLGLRSRCIQYFMPPYRGNGIPDFASLKGFFWQRQHDITWKEVNRLIKKTEFSKFYIHGAIDPGFEFYPPSKREIARYNISTSAWFQSKNDFTDVLKDCNVFFTSRRYEGIGMSFIEAMTMGQCVVAPDSPTMNEYIANGETGLLYDIDNIKPIDLSNAAAMGSRAREYCAEGFLRWNRARDALLEFMYSFSKRGRSRAKGKNKGSDETAEGKRRALLYSTLQEQYTHSESVKKDNERLNEELKNVLSSYSFRLGTMVLAPVKAVIGLMKKII